MFDPVGFNVRDRSPAFYRAALAPFGLGLLHKGKSWATPGGPGGYNVEAVMAAGQV